MHLGTRALGRKMAFDTLGGRSCNIRHHLPCEMEGDQSLSKGRGYWSRLPGGRVCLGPWPVPTHQPRGRTKFMKGAQTFRPNSGTQTVFGGPLTDPPTHPEVGVDGPLTTDLVPLTTHTRSFPQGNSNVNQQPCRTHLEPPRSQKCSITHRAWGRHSGSKALNRPIKQCLPLGQNSFCSFV